MLYTLHNVFSEEQVTEFNTAFSGLDYISGIATAPGKSTTVKDNLQIAHEDTAAEPLRQLFFNVLHNHAEFNLYCMPECIKAPIFSRYEAGMHYGNHIDNALMQISQQAVLRSDIACTVFLNDPDSYEGGELVLQLPSNEARIKLPAGSLVVYSPHYVHRVEPVTKGVRYAAVTWIQSRVANAEHRQQLFDLNKSSASLTQRYGLLQDDPDYLALNNLYQKLLREWSS